MGRLVIAHHKSYHPYRRDNIERVRRDEEEAAQAEAREDGRVLLAVRAPSPARIRTILTERTLCAWLGLGSADRSAARARGWCAAPAQA